jgi:hypothetical protein
MYWFKSFKDLVNLKFLRENATLAFNYLHSISNHVLLLFCFLLNEDLQKSLLYSIEVLSNSTTISLIGQLTFPVIVSILCFYVIRKHFLVVWNNIIFKAIDSLNWFIFLISITSCNFIIYALKFSYNWKVFTLC